MEKETELYLVKRIKDLEEQAAYWEDLARDNETCYKVIKNQKNNLNDEIKKLKVELDKSNCKLYEYKLDLKHFNELNNQQAEKINKLLEENKTLKGVLHDQYNVKKVNGIETK